MNILDFTFEAGLSSPARLYDLFVTCEAVTPGEFKRRGEGIEIHYGFHPSPFCECMVAATDRGICGLGFVRTGDRDAQIRELKERWENASISKRLEMTEPLVKQIFDFGRAIKKAILGWEASLCLAKESGK